MVNHFRMQIKDITKPTVWTKRLMQIRSTLERFHDIIQAAFGWESEHLFEDKSRPYISPKHSPQNNFYSYPS